MTTEANTRRSRGWRRKRLWLFLAVSLAAALLVGCESLSYYRQAIAGQYQIFARQQPIDKLLKDEKLSPKLKENLRLVLRLREFAEKQLYLPVDNHYLKYADLGRPYVVWNVYAAPELSLEQKTWWYPIVGSLKYRGYFAEQNARRYARRLEKKCWDVYVGGASAYSTLGWFKEPLLNTFIDDEEWDLAETLFHELAHQRVFASGDTDFNEAFATAVGQEGARRWLQAKSDTNALQSYITILKRDEQFVKLVQSTREKLRGVYGEADVSPQTEPPESEQRRRKAEIIAQLRDEYKQLRTSWDGYSGYDKWFAGPLNNAQLNTVATYQDLVPAFERLLAKHNGDLEKFYEEVKRMKKLSKDERRKRLEALMAGSQ